MEAGGEALRHEMAMGPSIAMRSIQITVFWTRQSEGAYLRSSRSSGGRVQDILAEFVCRDGEDQVRVYPTSRALFCPGRQSIEV